MSKVKFSENVKVKYIPSRYQEDRSTGFLLKRGLIRQCDEANKIIAKIINFYSRNKINRIDEDEDMIKIKLDGTAWYNDDSPLILLKYIQDQASLLIFLDEFNRAVKKSIPSRKSGSINYKSPITGFRIEACNVERWI